MSTGSADSPRTDKPQSRTTLFVVFTTILIDFIGFSVLIPVLPLYADRLGASAVEVGLILSLYALAQLIFLPVWGWVSDRFGRRRVILTSLAGTAGSFALLAVADDIPTIFLARVLAGAFGASIGTAQAVVMDLTPPSERASGMGLIGAAFGAGMIVGPMLGGFLAALDPMLPFVAIAALSTINLGLAFVYLPESRPEGLPRPPWRDLSSSLVPTPFRLLMAVHDRRIATYLLLFFIVFTAFSVLESMITLYLGRRFGASAFDAALIFAWIGFFLVLTQTLLLRHLLARLGELRLVQLGLAFMAIGIAAVAWVPGMGWLFALGPVIAFGNAIAFPSFTSLYSKACRAEEAGELLGQSQSMATAGRIVGPIGAGALMRHFELGTPFLAAGAVLAGALLLIWLLRGRLTEGL